MCPELMRARRREGHKQQRPELHRWKVAKWREFHGNWSLPLRCHQIPSKKQMVWLLMDASFFAIIRISSSTNCSNHLSVRYQRRTHRAYHPIRQERSTARGEFGSFDLGAHNLFHSIPWCLVHIVFTGLWRFLLENIVDWSGCAWGVANRCPGAFLLLFGFFPIVWSRLRHIDCICSWVSCSSRVHPRCIWFTNIRPVPASNPHLPLKKHSAQHQSRSQQNQGIRLAHSPPSHEICPSPAARKRPRRNCQWSSHGCGHEQGIWISARRRMPTLPIVDIVCSTTNHYFFIHSNRHFAIIPPFHFTECSHQFIGNSSDGGF